MKIFSLHCGYLYAISWIEIGIMEKMIALWARKKVNRSFFAEIAQKDVKNLGKLIHTSSSLPINEQGPYDCRISRNLLLFNTKIVLLNTMFLGGKHEQKNC